MCIHSNRHTQTIICSLNLLRFVVDLFPFFCHNTVSIIIYNQHDPLFAVPIYPFFLSFKHVACTLDSSTAHMEAAFESVQFLRFVLALFLLFLLLFVIFILRTIYSMNAIEFVENRGVGHQKSPVFSVECTFWNGLCVLLLLFDCLKHFAYMSNHCSIFVGILIVPH